MMLRRTVRRCRRVARDCIGQWLTQARPQATSTRAVSSSTKSAMTLSVACASGWAGKVCWATPGERTARKGPPGTRALRASLVRLRRAPGRRWGRSGDSLQAAGGRGAHLFVSSAPAGDRAPTVPLDLSEAALRLPARLHHRNVHGQPPAEGVKKGMRSRPATRAPLGQLLARRIRESGPLTLAEFMRECLYNPEHGYYSRAEGRRFADFYTSVDVHPIFGRLLARQLAQMWERLGKRSEEHTSELQSLAYLVCRLLLEKKKNI